MTRAHAADTKDEELYQLATRLEQAMEPLARAARLAARLAARQPDGTPPTPPPRYVGGLR
jgi:hypothetical protein